MEARAVVRGISQLAGVYGSVRFLRLFRARDELAAQLGLQWSQTGEL